MQTSFPISIFQGVLLGLSISLISCLLAIRIARRLKLVDIPGRELHKQHSQPIPLAGGISLLITLLLGWLLNPGSIAIFWKLMIPSLLVFGIGLVDDFHPIRFWIKLVGQICAAGLLIALGVQVHAVESGLRDFPILLAQGLDVFITILWLVGITNAYNFIDSMDGLATGLSVIVTFFFSFATLFSEQMELAHFMSYLTGAFLGMYLLNSAPAKLFLGDSGAMFMGFLLAEMSLSYNPKIFPQLSSWFVPVMVLGLPLFDIALVVFSRFRRGLPVYQADRGHTYHRLVALGLEPGRAVIAMHMASIALGCLAFIAMNQTPYIANAIFMSVCIVGLSLLVYLDHPKRWPKA
jgi:UDP-GlcNAc:undecaprenyl-phosphate GlcNAc-1-phosphate transferase